MKSHLKTVDVSCQSYLSIRTTITQKKLALHSTQLSESELKKIIYVDLKKFVLNGKYRTITSYSAIFCPESINVIA